MSVNDVLTLIVAVAAVAVPFAALFISSRVDQRTARGALSDLTLNISRKTTAYGELPADKKFAAGREIETLVLQAEDLIRRLTTRKNRVLFPQSFVAATLAMALDAVNDFWWSDKYWPAAAETAEEHFKVITSSYWGAALCRRGKVTSGRAVVNEALGALRTGDADMFIVRADVCLTMAQSDNKQAVDWLNKARQAYEDIPDQDQHEVYDPDGIPRLLLQGYDFSDANLTQADLTSADLTGTSFYRADLTGANLTNATLTNANLTAANLTDTILTGADLTGADLTGAVINQAGPPPTGWERDDSSGQLARAT